MSATFKLDRIRVQTARMIEIYALLRRELERRGSVSLSDYDRARLQHAVDTIAANMGQLLAQLARRREEPSQPQVAPAQDARTLYPGLGHLDRQEAAELEEILDAVLKWQSAAAANPPGD